ncbi:hypothetical protein A3D79_00330, partial [Candidatus Daviesbacteria bacterium RIFCSPHIGHO2_02_FULL_39_8]
MKKNDVEKIARVVIEIEESESETRFPFRFRKRLLELIKNKGNYLGGLFLVSSSFIGNVLNFFYNAFLGRILTFEHFALIGLIGGLNSFASIIFGAYTNASNYKSAFLIGKYGDGAGFSFWKYSRRLGIIIAAVFTLIWFIFTPFLTQFFDAETPWLIILFGLVLLVGLAKGADRGLISARLNFWGLAILNLFDPLIRLSATFLLVFLGLKFWTFSAIPIAALGIFIIGWILVTYKKNDKDFVGQEKEINRFPFKFYGVSVLNGISSTAFLSFDILLANHYLGSLEAGKYALFSLVGKMIYFLGGLTTPFIIPLLSRLEGARKSSRKTMIYIMGATTLLALIGFLSFGVFGFYTVPLLYGKKAIVITPYLIGFSFGMMCYTISKVLVNYYLVKKVYAFTFATSLLVVLQFILIFFNHANSASIASVMSIVWTLHLGLSLSFHIYADKI